MAAADVQGSRGRRSNALQAAGRPAECAEFRPSLLAAAHSTQQLQVAVTPSVVYSLAGHSLHARHIHQLRRQQGVEAAPNQTRKLECAQHENAQI